jgi:hypothetical protein
MEIIQESNVASEYLMKLSSDIYQIFYTFNSTDLIMSNLAIFLQKFGISGIIKIIHDVMDNPDELKRIASDSYFQGNGFYKIVLLKNEYFILRFHIWFPDNSSQENLHNHRWHLASTILNGNLYCELWKDSAALNAMNYDEYHYRNKYTNTTLIGKAKMELYEKKHYKAGDCYYQEPDVLHRIVQNANEMVATLMCHSSKSRDWSRNIALNDSAPAVKPEKYMSNIDLRKILNEYLNFM